MSVITDDTHDPDRPHDVAHCNKAKDGQAKWSRYAQGDRTIKRNDDEVTYRAYRCGVCEIVIGVDEYFPGSP